MRATGEQFLPAGVTSRVDLASESRWLEPMLVLTVHSWPAPVTVGGLLVNKWNPITLPSLSLQEGTERMCRIDY